MEFLWKHLLPVTVLGLCLSLGVKCFVGGHDAVGTFCCVVVCVCFDIRNIQADTAIFALIGEVIENFNRRCQ